jgi:hypothetical protein
MSDDCNNCMNKVKLESMSMDILHNKAELAKIVEDHAYIKNSVSGLKGDLSDIKTALTMAKGTVVFLRYLGGIGLFIAAVWTAWIQTK